MKKILSHLKSDWYKYLLELIVITAGVLGAFALNNWRDDRLDTKSEEYYLESLLNNLASDSIKINRIIAELNQAVGKIDSVMLMINGQLKYENALVNDHLYTLTNTFDYHQNSITFDNLVNSDRIDLLDKDLKNLLFAYYAPGKSIRSWSEASEHYARFIYAPMLLKNINAVLNKGDEIFMIDTDGDDKFIRSKELLNSLKNKKFQATQQAIILAEMERVERKALVDKIKSIRIQDSVN